ncbi:MAG: hypothetical protein EOO28_10430 [Comamonadaceae bacterium]|nr:MAG: hypothetical protein EOO28_10430 [Comamonadaceae bacterium]
MEHRFSNQPSKQQGKQPGKRTSIWLWRENFFGGTPVKRFSNSEPVREWLVLRALDSFAKGEYKSDEHQIAAAYARMVDELKRGVLVLDYMPTNIYMLDIPAIGHPLYLQAMVYWSVHMDCSLEELSEVHAELGPRPLLRDAYAAMSRLRQRGSRLTGRRPGSTMRQAKSAATVPVFARTKPFIANS